MTIYNYIMFKLGQNRTNPGAKLCEINRIKVWIFSLKTSKVLGRNYVYLSILHQNSFIVDYAHHINTTVIFAEMTYSLTSEKQWKQISIRFSS